MRTFIGGSWATKVAWGLAASREGELLATEHVREDRRLKAEEGEINSGGVIAINRPPYWAM